LRHIKKSVVEAVAAGQGAEVLEVPSSRHARITVRATLCQLSQKAAMSSDESLMQSVELWRRRFDSSSSSVDDEPDEQSEHYKQHVSSPE
ncbi:MAG: hypothetical protein AAGF81_22625, partial [Pseudomonadota bacterium]